MSPSNDDQFMRLALAEGAKGLGLTAPNPSVGAVVVRAGEILGRGYHHRAGLPHAEREAFTNCDQQGHDLEGATLYVTLEPCSTTGRTPPCTQAIIERGIQRVVWAADDPNPLHCGAAKLLLESAEIAVQSGVLATEAEELHRAFFKVQRKGLPWVIVKTALTLDGRITRPPGEGQWLTSAEARADVQKIRGEVDAIITSGRTARSDNPRLNYRGLRAAKNQPLRIVFSRQERGGLSPEAHLLIPNEAGPTRFLTGSFREELKRIAEEGYHTVLLEAGGDLVGQFLDQGLVDEWISYLAPLVAGGPTPGVGGQGVVNLATRPRLYNVSYASLGSDIRVHGYLAKVEQGD